MKQSQRWFQPFRGFFTPAWGGLMAFVLGMGCATYRNDLDRGQRYYDESQYEHALSVWRVLEADIDSLSLPNQARYAYLRGMTDYRLGARPDARHWLGIARAFESDNPGLLSNEARERLTEALNELNREVYGLGADIAAPAAASGTVGAAGAPG